MRFRHNSDKADELRKVPLFEHLSRRELEQLAGAADEVDSKPGEVLMRQGEMGRELVMVVDGSVRIERGAEVIARRGAGEFIGEMALLDQKPRIATVVTDTPSTLLVIHSTRFWSVIDGVPAIERKLLMSLAGRMRELQDRVD